MAGTAGGSGHDVHARLRSNPAALTTKLVIAAALCAVPLLFSASTRIAQASSPWAQGLSLLTGSFSATALMAIPGVAVLVALWALRPMDARSLPWSLTVVLAGSGVLSWFVFWVWAVNPVVGRVAALAVFVASVAIVAVRVPGLGRRIAPVVVALAIAVGATVLANGYLFIHGGYPFARQISQAATFAEADNAFPKEWADRVEHRQSLVKPALGGWPLADRPPMQTAWIMSGYTITSNKEVGYQLLSGALQSLAVVGVALCLVRCGLRRWRLVLATAMVTLTPFILYNTAYVWPKLFPAGLLLVGIAALMQSRGAASRIEGIALGALLGMSAIAHPGGLFAAPAILVIFLATDRSTRMTWPQLLAVVIGALAVGLPWIGYRLFYDHSSSMLAYWHLAGLPDRTDHRSLLQAIIDQYRAAGFDGWLHRRWSNFADLVATPYLRQRSSLRKNLRAEAVMAPLWSGVSLLLAAPAIYIFRRRLRREVVTLAAAGAVSLLLWTMVEYGPPAALTITVSGPYGAFLLLSIGFAAALATVVSTRVMAAVVAVQAGVYLWLQLPVGALDGCRGHSVCTTATYPAGTTDPGRILVAFVIVALVGALVAGAAVFLLPDRDRIWSRAALEPRPERAVEPGPQSAPRTAR